MVGDANIAEPSLTWRFTTKNFAAVAAMIQKET